jgi:hypothetical protein
MENQMENVPIQVKNVRLVKNVEGLVANIEVESVYRGFFNVNLSRFPEQKYFITPKKSVKAKVGNSWFHSFTYLSDDHKTEIQKQITEAVDKALESEESNT